MTLISKLDPTNEARTIDFHSFSSAIYLFTIGSFTRTEFETVLNLDATDDAQVDLLVAHYQALSATDKAAYRDVVESAGILWEQGRITQAQFIALIGLS